jgi:putative transposase
MELVSPIGMGHLNQRARVAVQLRPMDRAKLQDLLRGGHDEVRHIKRAQMLLHFDRGESASQIANAVGVTPKTVRSIGKRYLKDGLEKALEDDPRPGARPIVSEKQKQEIIAMTCTTPPDGLSRWSIRVIADEAMKRKIVPHIGREAVRVLLLCHDLKPWRKKNVVHRRSKFRIFRKNGGCP